LEAGQEIVWETTAERHVYAVAATGAIEVEGKHAKARDGVAITGSNRIVFRAVEGPAEIVLTDTV
jgi:redox-sensitive bicupin YhaK (pirin superfamily)